MTLRRLLPAAIALAALLPASASAAVLKGTVVHHSKKSFVVASSSGTLYRVHSSTSPKARRTVSVRAAKLNNGSYKATKVKTTGRAKTARLSGVVSYRKGRTFVVSSAGASLLVHGNGAKVGRRVLVRAKVSDDGTLDETSGEDRGKAHEMEVEGTITATLLERANPGAISARKDAAGRLYNVSEFAAEIARAAVEPVPEDNTRYVGDTSDFAG